MTLEQFFRALRRHWRIPLVVWLGALLAVGLILSRRESTVEYRASAKLAVSDVNVPTQLRGGLQLSVAGSEEVRAAARRAIKLDDPNRARVAFALSGQDKKNKTPREPTVLAIVVTSPDQNVPPALARAHAQALLAKRKSLQVEALRQRQAESKSALEGLKARLAQLATALGQATASGNSLEREVLVLQKNSLTQAIAERQLAIEDLAAAEQAADGSAELLAVSGVDKVTTTDDLETVGPVVLLLVLAATVGFGGAILASRRDAAFVQQADDAAAVFDAPVLATVPRSRRPEKEPVVVTRQDSDRAQAIRALASTLEAIGGTPSRLLVTSPVESDSAPALGVNLAVSLAQLGLRVVLIGTDSCHVELLETLGVECGVGFGDLVERARASDLNGQVAPALVPATLLENLWVLPPGGNSAPAGPRAVERVLAATQDSRPPILGNRSAVRHAEGPGVDVCVVLGRPPLEDSVTSVLAREAGNVLWVVETGATPTDVARLASQRLALTGARVVGVAVVEPSS